MITINVEPFENMEFNKLRCIEILEGASQTYSASNVLANAIVFNLDKEEDERYNTEELEGAVIEEAYNTIQACVNLIACMYNKEEFVQDIFNSIAEYAYNKNTELGFYGRKEEEENDGTE